MELSDGAYVRATLLEEGTNFDTSMYLILGEGNCESDLIGDACLMGRDVSGNGGEEIFYRNNTSDSGSQMLYFIVDGVDADEQGEFAIQFEIGFLETPTNDLCNGEPEALTPVNGYINYEGSFDFASEDHSPTGASDGCLDGDPAEGPDLAYTLELEPGYAANVRIMRGEEATYSFSRGYLRISCRPGL